jgi:hypothetical protein
MYICYVDESGHCGSKFNPDEPYEVMCGVLTDFTKLSKSQREHDLRLRILNVPELKASDAYRGRKDWSSVPPAQRDTLFDDLLAWADERGFRFIVSPIDSDRFFDLKATGCATSNRFGAPWQAAAMHVLLSVQRAQSGKDNNKGRTVIVFDEEPGHDVALLKLLEDDLAYTDCFTGYEPPKKGFPDRLNQIIDVPHFSKSHLAVLIQIADWAGFVINKGLLLRVAGLPEKYDGEAAKFERWYRGIERLRIPPSFTDPPRSKDPLSMYFRTTVRPSGWSAKKWP